MHSTRLATLGALGCLLTLGACGGPEVGPRCGPELPCPSSGQVCDDGVCRRIVGVDAAPVPDAHFADVSYGPDVRISDDATLDAPVLDAPVLDAGLDAPALDAGSDAPTLDARLDAPTPDAWSCRTNVDCTSADGASFCETPRGACGRGGGTCAPRPTTCGVDDLAPSCGCDGRLYASPCWRQLAGVAEADASLCGATTYCRLEHRNADCPAEHLCESDAVAAGVCPATGDGTCHPIEASCAAVPAMAPIECGCDGRTYASACERRRRGARFAGAGFCPCDAGRPCAAPDTFCDYGLAYSNDDCASHTTGVCSRVPAAEECDMAARAQVQTCGVADTTTRSDCERRSMRIPSAFAPPDCGMPGTGFCYDDGDCTAAAGNHCYGAVCTTVAGSCRLPPAPPGCLADADCNPGFRCGASAVCEVNPLAVMRPS